jgi:hypothetical protein
MTQLSIKEFFPTAFLNESTFNHSLGENFTLCENENVIFHWADYDETCDAFKAAIETNSELKDEYRKKELSLGRLALIPVWIRTDKKVHQTTMFELYERYILNQVQVSLGVDPFGPIQISFISGTGPFRSLAIAECFNKSTYKDFVMVYLIQGKLPKRDFRIRMKAKVLMEYGENFSKAELIGVEQLTSNGILFSLDSDLFLKDISVLNEIRILIDTDALKEGKDKSLNDLRTHLSQYAFNLLYSSRAEDSLLCQVKDFNIQSSFDFYKNKKIYLFISYDELKASSGSKIHAIKNFVFYAKNLIREHYNFNLLSKSA